MPRHPLVELTLVKVRELVREPEAVFWIFAFPLILALVLGVAFRRQGPEVLAVGVVEGGQASWIEDALGADEAFKTRLLDAQRAREQLRTGRLALVVLPAEPEGEGWTYWFDPTRPESRLARLAVDDTLQRAAGRVDVVEAGIREMTEKGSRYIDFLVPGLLGMNLMGTGMWGVGFAIVLARSKGRLKRLLATPMRRSHYLLSQIGGRLIFLLPEVVILVLFAHFVLGVPVQGSVVLLFAVSVVGAMAFSGLGLLVASRAQTVEGVSGLMNLVMLPMWVLSGIFFSTARFPDAMQPLIQALPLTALNDALRSVMIDGVGIAAVVSDLAVIAVWAVAAFVGALALFRWS